MFGIGYIIWGIVILYVIISRGLPKFISWILCRALNAEVKIGRISLLPFSLKDVRICKNNFTVVIESIGVSSNLVNSSYSKILAIYVGDVRIEKELGEQPEDEGDDADLPESGQRRPNEESRPSALNIPPQIITLSQITSIHIYNVNVMLLKIAKNCLFHATISEVKLEGTTDQACMQVSLNICNFASKLLHHVEDSTALPCLVEINSSSNLIISVDPKKQLRLKAFSLSILPELDVILSEGLLTLFSPGKSLSTRDPSVSGETADDKSTGIQKIWNCLPETLNLNMENAKLKLLCENQDRSLLLSMKKLLSTTTFSSILMHEHLRDELLLPGELETTFLLEDFNINTGLRRVVALTKSEAKLFISEHRTEISTAVSAFSCRYHHADVLCWLEYVSKWSRRRSLGRRPSDSADRNGHLEKLFKRPHKITFELCDVTTGMFFTQNSAISSGLARARFTLEGKKCLPEGPELDRSLDGLLESWWCHVGEQPLPDNPNKKHHYWNTPVFVGVLLFEAKQQYQCGRKIESMVDCAHLEWSQHLDALVMDIFRCLRELKTTLKGTGLTPSGDDKPLNSQVPAKPKWKLHKPEQMPLHIHAAITNTNLFALCDKRVGFLLRADSGNFETLAERLSFSIEGIKVVTIVPSGTYSPCIKSSELKNCLLDVATASVAYQRSSREIAVHLSSQTSLHWTTADHLTAHGIVSDIRALKTRTSKLFLEPELAWAPTAAPRRSKQILVRVKLDGPFFFTARLTSTNSMRFTVREFSLRYHQGSLKLGSEELIVEFDRNDIVTLHHVEIATVAGSAALKAGRQSFDLLEMKENKAWNVVIGMAKICFPHNYNFADVFTEKVLSITKWLKLLHRSKTASSAGIDALPPDLCIKIKEIMMEICDDPFEVHLRDNYELLEDEYNESQKRWKMLDAKVDELRKTHLHLPATKVNELYRSLAKRNADIYIKRSRQMYGSSPMRTHLFTVNARDVEILSLADPTMHGKEKILDHMRSLDPESPWPDEDLKFTTLWCRMVQFSSADIAIQLRDYPSPLLSSNNFTAWGMLIGAEQEPSKRAKRSTLIEISEPWSDATVERSMPPLKFYYDISCDVEHLTVGNGPCWEPAIAEFSLASDLISRPSADPSPPLPFWDKVRLLFHGRLTMMIQQLTMVLHSSLDPCNTTEQMDFTWTDLEFDWTNAKFVLKGNLDVHVRTASKYDDCHLLHFPNLKLAIKLDWQCVGDPNDHHAVMPCAPDKLPEYSINQKHDSYRAFRSLNVNLAIVMDTKPASTEGNTSIPSMLFYSNTLKWLENLKVILSGVTRPIRRGIVFNNCKPRKVSLSRHYKAMRFSLSLHQFEVCYWMSFAKQRGFRLQAEKLMLSTEYNLSLSTIDDGLKHRPLATLNVVYMNCELSNGEIWLQSAASDDTGNEMNVSFRAPVEKSYFLSLSRVSYGREASVRCSAGSQDVPDTPMHRLVVHDLKGSWTKNNRTIVFGLFDSFMRNKLLRHNISTEALKGFKVDPSSSSPMKSRGTSAPPVAGSVSPIPTSATSPLSRIQSGHAINMLQKLISEADNNSVVFSEDLSGNTREQILHGVVACQTDDVLHRNWLVELINSQVFLKGCETPGYVIMSASRAQILQRIHQPVWKERTLVSKTTWVGSLEGMQYYATVDSGVSNCTGENIQWLTLENIEEKESMVIEHFADLVGSGQGVGGVVSNTVGGGSAGGFSSVQLQRIASRCGCQFFYASYGESLDPNSLEEVPPLVIDADYLEAPPEDSEIWRKDKAVDSFTLTHQDLNCCTNSVQYLMLLDIVNNLLLYVEPGKKEAIEKLKGLRFQLQLSSIEDQRRPILLLQNNLRLLISSLRRLEKESYMLQKSLDENASDESLIQQMEVLENQIYDNKVQISAQADELAMMISCFKETQISANRNLKTAKDQQVPLRRHSEVCFKHAQWRLTEADGQLSIADIALSNFLYSKATKIDDSAEHLLELGYIKVTNSLPNQIYKDVLQPTELRGNIPIDRQCALRIFCREKAPVGGISIKEHFEVNVVPMTLRVTYQFFKTMLKFCFPEKDSELPETQGSEDLDQETASIASGGSIRSSKRSRLQQRRTISTEDQDDIEKMKERAEKNKMFLYIKIPEVPVRVSYKGEKEKNIEDVHDFNLVLQTLEYHNVTWTWLDLLLAMKSDSKKALLSQAIKQKLQIKSRATLDEQDNSLPHEEDKARLLMGSLLTGGNEKNRRHNLFGKLHKSEPK